MNSEPRETAAWRAFGMLDPDESASFDQAVIDDPELAAAWRDVDCLTAAIAAAAVQPVVPRAGQLERLHRRLGLITAPPARNWTGISGWAAAAAVTLLLIYQQMSPPTHQITARRLQGDERGNLSPHATTAPALPATPPTSLGNRRATSPVAQLVPEADPKLAARAETKRLIQKIEVLRGQLEGLEQRDRRRFTPVAGMAWPIVMRMTPPTLTPAFSSELADDLAPTITEMLGDALFASTPVDNPEAARGRPIPPQFTSPTAIPIYDAARDQGTLVVSSLPQIAPDETYNLWVIPEAGGAPIRVGSLPPTDQGGADSFDFNLGSPGIVPSGFILTKDSSDREAPPTSDNTVLQGPH